jgi:hypothetical protein
MSFENFLDQHDSRRAFLWPLAILLFLEFQDVVLMALISAYFPDFQQANALLLDSTTGQFLVFRTLEVKVMGLGLTLGPLSLGAYLGTRSWFLASLPLYYGIAISGLALFDNLAILFFV